MHSRTPASKIRFIHHVVVEQGEVMESLYAESRAHGLGSLTSESIGTHESEHRPYSLSACRECIFYGTVE